jgi:hypothetical protein
VATRDPSAVDAELVALLGDLSRRAGRPASDAEIRSALAPLRPSEEAVLRQIAPGALPAQPLGPMAWAEVARGVEPGLAAAREKSGYYTLLAERDALASLLKARLPTSADLSPEAELLTEAGARPEPALAIDAIDPLALKRGSARASPKARPSSSALRATRPPGRAEEILGLFAYHRDAPLVARALSLSMAELEAEIDGLKLRRMASRLVRGRDVDMPAAAAVPGVGHGPPVRRRVRAPVPAQAPATKVVPSQPEALAVAAPAQRRSGGEQDVEAQATRLRELLRQTGPRRDALAKKLGAPGKALPIPVLLARFRAAGLEREFGQRERDLLRALLKRNRAALGPVAKELKLDAKALETLIRERGLAREVEAERAAMREKVRARGAQRDRVDQVLRQREWLADLGLLDELDGEVDSMVRALWRQASDAGLRGTKAVESLRRELRVPAPDVRALLSRLKLRA